jgi:hypothetical protein
MARPIMSFEAPEIDDFDQLAGLAAAMDVIVTVQTTLVHLCGAIGQACRVLVPQVPEWRYGAHGARMPWYESVTLYRQDRPGSWSEPMGRLIAGIGDRDG